MKKKVLALVICLILMVSSFGTMAVSIEAAESGLAGPTRGLADEAFSYGALDGATEVGAYISQKLRTIQDLFSEDVLEDPIVFKPGEAGQNPTPEAQTMWFLADFGELVHVNTISM